MALKLTVLCTLFLAMATQAQAIERIRADQTSCAQILSIINTRGEAILRYPSKRVANLILFDRYVGHDRFCPRGYEAKVSPIASADNARCPVQQCEEIRPWYPLPGFD